MPKSPDSVLVVDAANVIGSRPDGWWKDRGAATRRLHESLLVIDTEHDLVILVLEGGAKGGARVGRDGHVQVVHAPKDGDTTIVAQARSAAQHGAKVTVVTADRALQANCAGVGAGSVSPGWLLDLIDVPTR